MAENYVPTGNEMISIPTLIERDASIQSVNFLHMGYKGLIEICGEEASKDAFMKPWIKVDEENKNFENIRWFKLNYWVPTFEAQCGDILINGTILTPINERGFIYHLKLTNQGKSKVDFSVGLKGCWSKTFHTINERKVIESPKYIYKSGWNDSFICDLRNPISLFSFAPIFEEKMDREYFNNEDNIIQYEIGKSIELNYMESKEISFYWGFGFEEVGSSTAAKEMMRKGYKKILCDTLKWLSQRQRSINDERLDKIFNTNLFFNFFYAAGRTLDTEEFVLVTSRSPRYYVSAAYWDRDSLLWSFPSILITDLVYARNIIEYIFTRQIRNVGVHSRYIDGTVLEPGFELDELCAPIIALYNYVNISKDKDILNEPFIKKGIQKILWILNTKKHNKVELYETFLQPTDDVIVHPYITYNNVLVWKALLYLAELMENGEADEYSDFLREKAKLVREAIWENCVVEYEGKRVFAWSIDLEGKHNIYDEPPGSLQLLFFYGFCSLEDAVYKNTMEVIRRPEYAYSFYGCNIAEIGCEHAPHPWVLSIANSLLCGRTAEFLKLFPYLKMDNGIACESVDENTGEAATGNAFATCAGFLAYALYNAFYKKTE